MKRRQRVCRPLGGTSPLSDRAPRDNGDVRRPSEYDEAKATSTTSPVVGSSGVREHGMHIQRALEPRISRGRPSRMTRYNIKKDNFKTRIILPLEVRLPHISEEAR